MCYLFQGVNCSTPPVKPGAGTWDWDGSYTYGTNISYTCGPYGKFVSPGNIMFETQISTCGWNRSWVPDVLPDCVATYCPQIPFPPASTGLVYRPDAKNNMTLKSGSVVANISNNIHYCDISFYFYTIWYKKIQNIALTINSSLPKFFRNRSTSWCDCVMNV
jgi:hypothetical protein